MTRGAQGSPGLKLGSGKVLSIIGPPITASEKSSLPLHAARNAAAQTTRQTRTSNISRSCKKDSRYAPILGEFGHDFMMSFQTITKLPGSVTNTTGQA